MSPDTIYAASRKNRKVSENLSMRPETVYQTGLLPCIKRQRREKSWMCVCVCVCVYVRISVVVDTFRRKCTVTDIIKVGGKNCETERNSLSPVVFPFFCTHTYTHIHVGTFMHKR